MVTAAKILGDPQPSPKALPFGSAMDAVHRLDVGGAFLKQKSLKI